MKSYFKRGFTACMSFNLNEKRRVKEEREVKPSKYSAKYQVLFIYVFIYYCFSLLRNEDFV